MPHNNTSHAEETSPLLTDKGVQQKSRAQQVCEATGGTWDLEKQVCIRPEQEQEQEPETDKKTVRPFRDAETGDLTGLEVRGKTLLGLNPEQVREGVESATGRQELQVGSQGEVVLQRRQEEQRAQLQQEGIEATGQIGASPSPEVLQQINDQISVAGVNYLGAAAAAFPGIIPDLVTGFGAGLFVTKGRTRGLVPIGLAVGNAVQGFYRDFVSDVRRQKREIIETPIRTLSETKPILNEIINAQNANPEDRANNIEAFNNQLAFIDQEYDRLKEETDDVANLFLGDTGINQLQEFEVYYALDGERQRQIDDFALALANPDPARIRPTSVTLDELEARLRRELG